MFKKLEEMTRDLEKENRYLRKIFDQVDERENTYRRTVAIISYDKLIMCQSHYVKDDHIETFDKVHLDIAEFKSIIAKLIN
ncbi:hypothetical protein ACFSND_32825 [Brevibacillus brevis]|uniref:hypothetical protein n=1 Tax=Brevibacillus brevis TaxID=1393 RepID=UPI000D0F9940|nr:hypothetical protein C7J99_27935 [Brevibacillus brevis]GEC93863.1 hypothetical protein BBR01nite_61940 [Brevibacillus brevis]